MTKTIEEAIEVLRYMRSIGIVLHYEDGKDRGLTPSEMDETSKQFKGPLRVMWHDDEEWHITPDLQRNSEKISLEYIFYPAAAEHKKISVNLSSSSRSTYFGIDDENNRNMRSIILHHENPLRGRGKITAREGLSVDLSRMYNLQER